MMNPTGLLIVGAGFSHYAGLPLARDFTAELLNTKNLSKKGPSRPLVEFIKDYTQKVFLGRKRVSASDWPDLEDFFTVLDLSANTGHHLGDLSASHLRLVRRATIVRMIRMLNATYKENLRNPGADWDALEALFQRFKYDSTAVLSLNWDMVFERGMARTQGVKHIDYGCNAQYAGFKSNGIFSTWTKQNGDTLHITKPHGSVNWLYCDACRSLFWINPNRINDVAKTLINANDWRKISSIADNRYVFEVNTPPCPECSIKAIGTRFATFSFRKALDFPMYSESWRTSERNMLSADNWIFFGYSMPSADFEFKSLLKRVQLAKKREVNIIVITGGNGASETVDRFKRFFGKGPGMRKYHKNGLDSYALADLQAVGVIR